MATYKHGINGAFKGKVGPVIGSSWQGITYMKSLYFKPVNSRSTFKWLNQQHNFGIVSKFMNCMLEVINLGFNKQIKGHSSFNNAMSYATKNALDTTTTPNTIVYSRMLINRGKYPNAAGLSVSSCTKGEILFKWTDNSGTGIGRPNDNVVLVAYSTLQKMAIYKTNGEVRSSEKAELKVMEFSGEMVETYVSFQRADGTDVSESVYTGQVAVA